MTDPLTYQAAAGISVCESDGTQQDLKVYFVKVAENKWDVYATFDSDLVAIDGGSTDASGLSKATLEFDESGNFVRQDPYLIYTQEFRYPETDFCLEIDFYSHDVTHKDAAFTVTDLASNGC